MKTRIFAIALVFSALLSVPTALAQDAGESAGYRSALLILDQYVAKGCDDPALFELRQDLVKKLEELGNHSQTGYSSINKIAKDSPNTGTR